jgi:hypothetical protein
MIKSNVFHILKQWADYNTTTGGINWESSGLNEKRIFFTEFLNKVSVEYTSALPVKPKVAIMTIAFFMAWVISSTWCKSQQRKNADLGKFNVDKFANDVKDAVMFYVIKSDPDHLYPTYTEITHNVNYSNYQLMRWIELTHRILSEETAKEIGIYEKMKSDNYTKELEWNEYISAGLSVGNLTDPDRNTYSPKFDAVLKIMDGKRAVIYSQFIESGVNLFMNFLKSKTKPFLYLNKGLSLSEKQVILQEFGGATAECFLILHPTYTEGISITGAEQLHVLEPLAFSSTYSQLIARVIRYKSHEHLPVEKRKVEIHQWIITAKNANDLFKQPLQYLLSDYKTKVEGFMVLIRNNLPLFLTNRKYKHPFYQEETPDEIVSWESQRTIEDENLIKKNLKLTETDVDCCITYPNAEQEETCRKTRKSCR